MSVKHFSAYSSEKVDKVDKENKAYKLEKVPSSDSLFLAKIHLYSLHCKNLYIQRLAC